MAQKSAVSEEQRGTSRARSSLLPSPPAPPPVGASPVDISSFTHTPCYCEENVYLLCKRLSTIGLADPKGSDLFVVFISNEEKKVPMWCQKASKRVDGLVVWDYHVICIQSKRNRKGIICCRVWDLDSRLAFPFPLNKYSTEAFHPTSSLSPEYRRLFRVVHAPVFLRYFASDRSHMKDPIGNWISLPPTYEPIVAEDGAIHNLDEYVRMHASDAMTDIEVLIDGLHSNRFGVVITEPTLDSLFSKIQCSRSIR